MERTLETRDDLLTALLAVQHELYACARLDQRLSHETHRTDYYRDLLDRLNTLIVAERALNTRIKTIGR
jgi:hypothetical protein